MSNPPFDFGFQAMAEFRANAGRSMLRAQDEAGRAFAESVSALPAMAAGVPGGPPPGTIAESEGLTQAIEAVSQFTQAAMVRAGTELRIVQTELAQR